MFAQPRRRVKTVNATLTPNVEALEQRQMMTAVPLNGYVFVHGTSVAARPELAGAVIYDNFIPFLVKDTKGNPIASAILEDRIVRETNGGTLDFYQRLINVGTYGTLALDDMSRYTTTGFPADADYRTDGLGSPSAHPIEALSVQPNGNGIDFYNFGNILPGQSSLFVFDKTSAKSYDLNGGTQFDINNPAQENLGDLSQQVVTTEPVRTPQHLSSISGTVYNDLNADGKRQTNEPPLAGREIYLDLNNDGKVESYEPHTLTNSAGKYAFANVVAGTYAVREAPMTGWRVTAPASGVNTVVAPVAGATLTGQDFGNTKAVVISGTVFNDANRDGRQGRGEAGLANWRVYLDVNNTGVIAANDPSILTDSTGKYKFVEPAGTYHVRVVKMPAYVQTAPTGGQFSLVLTSGQQATGRNFGELFVG